MKGLIGIVLAHTKNCVTPERSEGAYKIRARLLKKCVILERSEEYSRIRDRTYVNTAYVTRSTIRVRFFFALACSSRMTQQMGITQQMRHFASRVGNIL
ncbi:MAG: hypothetical protein GX602_06530 [Dehalococcoidales bacterium]|nr:hypothetical protein [Dehalococcoidales bacterium]